ncbi:MAG: ROK family protein [Anaerolineae bacterium]|nr:ROK family protein [Anaerolineae bacterium]
MSWVIGIDLGGTKTAVGLVSPENQVVGQRRIATHEEEGPASIVERIAGQIADLEREHGQKAEAVGICCPGPVDHRSGSLLTLVNLPGLSNTPLRRLLADRLGLPVRLDHDAKAAALGEFHYGAGRGRGSMVYVVIGTGVGAAIILDGKLHYGESNTAGEVGHITVDRHGDLCACGSRGCMETYTSGPWLARRYRVATEPVAALVSEAWAIGRRAGLEPTLILAVIAIESSFNPFAQSPVGAQGLMQVMTRVHDDKYGAFGGTHAAFDPITNLRVGVQVLKECIARAGSVAEGLRYYVGAAALASDGGSNGWSLSSALRIASARPTSESSGST